jgi:hypothetical protein
MTKTIKPAASAQVQPRAITLIGTTISVMQQVAILVRAGYYPDPQMPLEFFGAMGTMQIVLVPGTPEAHYANAAAVALSEAADREHAVYLKDVEAAAKRQIADAAKLEVERQRAALVAENREKIAALEASIAAL